MEFNALRSMEEKYEVFKNLDIDKIVKKSKDQDTAYFSSTFNSLAKEYFEKEKFAEASAFLLLSDVTSMGCYSDNYSLEFSPMITGPAGRSSIIDDFTESDLDIFEEIIPDIENSVLKARLSEVVWQRRRHHKWAKFAVDSYYEYAKVRINEEKDRFLSQKPFERALLIGKKIKYEEKIKEIVENLQSWINENSDKEEYFIIDRLAKLLIYLKIGNLEEIGKVLENLISLSVSKNNFHLAVQRCDIVSNIWASLKNPDKKRFYDLKAVELLQAESKHFQKEGDSLNATSPLSQAYARLKTIGDTEDLRKEVNDELVKLQEDSKEHLFSMKHEFDLTKVANEAISFVKGIQKKDALINFALLLKLKKLEDLENEVKQNIRNFPFQNFVHQVVIDKKGRNIGYIPSLMPEEENNKKALNVKMIQTAAQMASLNAMGVITPMLRTIMEEYYIDLEILEEFLVYNPIVPDDRVDMFIKGFHACFKNDFVTGMSLLIPQIENVIRHLLEINGHNTSTFNKDAQRQEDRMLTDLMHTFKDELIKILGCEMYFELNHIFNERISFNIRNDFSHGKMGVNEFNSYNTIYAFWLIWKLCVIGRLRYQHPNNNSKEE